LGKSRIAGYDIGVLGFEQTHIVVAAAWSSLSVYLAVSCLVIGWMNGSVGALKVFSWITGVLLGLAFCGLWSFFLYGDHLLSNTDGYQLFGCSLFLGIGSILLCWLGFRGSAYRRRRKPRAKKVLQAEPLAAEDAPDTNEVKDDIPSVETLLNDDVVTPPSEGQPEGDEPETPDADEAPPPVPSSIPEVDSGYEPSAEEAPPLPSVADSFDEPPPAEEAPPLPSVADSFDEPLPAEEAPPLPSAADSFDEPPPVTEEAMDAPPSYPTSETSSPEDLSPLREQELEPTDEKEVI
jgi:hypothetical protein